MVKLIISCEHGGNKIPVAYQKLFTGASKMLASHRGYDIGALRLAKALAPLADYSQFCTVSRLLIELNRSTHHPKLFSEFTRDLAQETKQELLKKYYQPYRDTLVQQISQYSKAKQRVIHISVHSFTPILNGEVRNTDIGLLYDPSRQTEREFASAWRKHFLACSELKVRNNYPYQGKSDGLTTYLRKQFSTSEYIGIELETNQALWQGSAQAQAALRRLIANTLNCCCR
jgi:predicted N-formylglutamate amidohydrolase